MIGVVNLYDNRFGYNQKGFTSIINQLIEICLFHFEKNDNFTLHVSDRRVENFYDLLKIDLSEQKHYDVSNPYLEHFFKYGFPEYNAHNIVNNEDIKKRNFIFNKIFKLKNKIISQHKKYDLGIHIRGTDKKTEIRQIDDNTIINKISEIINRKNIKNVFLATDEYKYIKLIEDNFSKKISLSYNKDNIFSHDGTPIHFQDDRTLLDRQVLNDSYNLANSNNLIYCFSNVSLFSIMINNNSYEEKILLNNI